MFVTTLFSLAALGALTQAQTPPTSPPRLPPVRPRPIRPSPWKTFVAASTTCG